MLKAKTITRQVLKTSLKVNWIKIQCEAKTPAVNDLVYSKAEKPMAQCKLSSKNHHVNAERLVVPNRMPSRVSEIRVDQAYSGYHRRGPSIGEIKCETSCCVVVNQVGDVYRSVRSEIIIMLSMAVISYVGMMFKGTC